MQMDVQAPICIFLSRINGEGGLAATRPAFAVLPAAVQAACGSMRE